MKETHTGFMGTYFNKDVVLRVAKAARVLAWVALGISGAQLLLNIGTDISLVVRGFWSAMGFFDIVQNILSVVEMAIPGAVYFFALMGIAHFLLIFLDVEDNTRRAAR